MWDSALDRRELGESIASRFHGAVTYFDEPKSPESKQERYQYKTSAILDWATLHPVERLQLLTTHDLARQEKQKLELLRHLLTYYHYAASESRDEVLRTEINRVRAPADELRDRYRAQFNHPLRRWPKTTSTARGSSFNAQVLRASATSTTTGQPPRAPPRPVHDNLAFDACPHPDHQRPGIARLG